MARFYIFKCDQCGEEFPPQPTETFPPEWMVFASRGRGLDLCSLSCGKKVLDAGLEHEAQLKAEAESEKLESLGTIPHQGD